MLVCIDFSGGVEAAAAAAIGASLTTVFAIWRYYAERKHDLKLKAYTRYITAFQELVAHLNDDKNKPLYQNTYYIARSIVYLCAPLSVLKTIREMHCKNQNSQNTNDIIYFRRIVEAMRADLKMDEIHDFPFELVMINDKKHLNHNIA